VPLADRAPRVDLVKWRLPGASVLSGRFGGVQQRGEPESGTVAELFFGINAAGDSLARQQRREITIGQYVLDQRLALACRRLRDTRLAGRTISSIAHDAGFGDLSYFNRTFRRRYGVTPSGARAPAPG
jgi:methylphosphotriester-DNA--protein-cysteine methyltransferase